MPLASPIDVKLLRTVGEGAPSVQQKTRHIKAARGRSPAMSDRVDGTLVAELENCQRELEGCRKRLEKLEDLLRQYVKPPWHLAVFLRVIDIGEDPRAEVMFNGSRRLVNIGEDVDPQSLGLGDEVFLAAELNTLLAASPGGPSRCGETAQFERALEDGLVVIRSRDSDIIVETTEGLREGNPRSGDLVRWDRATWTATEKIETSASERYMLEEVDGVALERVGGQDANLQKLVALLTGHLKDPERAVRYGMSGKCSALMVGPPGCGKTLMARAAVSEVSRLSEKKCRFAVIKPAEFEDPFVGVTQMNIRRCFEALRLAAQEGFAVLFMDEIESMGRARGNPFNHHSDKFLAALLAEIDGFESRSNVALLFATNRRDLIDPALLERMSDNVLTVRRPNLAGARAIFEIHLSDAFPYSTNGRSAEETRRACIDAATDRLFATRDNEVCNLQLRDGKTRTVTAADLMSGRLIEQICRDARHRAFLRDMGGGDRGVTVPDVQGAVETALERLAGSISARNASLHLGDLPMEADVVAVDPVVRRVREPHRYLRLEAN